MSEQSAAASLAAHSSCLSPQQSPRWKRALSATNGAMDEAVGKMYVARYFPAQDKARILTLDQFPRHIFRGTARAYATDPLALASAGLARKT